jgi:hypothetical protein
MRYFSQFSEEKKQKTILICFLVLLSKCRWAIEGAVGSADKVDATYLSRHVNMASRLEAATKFYGVRVLFSGQVAGLLLPELEYRLIRIDYVVLKGAATPTLLYTLNPMLADEDGDFTLAALERTITEVCFFSLLR